MLTLRHPSRLDLFERLDQQLQTAARIPAAEVHETEQAYAIALELPGVEKGSIDVKATERSLVITAERKAPASERDALLSEFRYGTWSRSFRFPSGINRDGLTAQYRDGVLTVTAAKAQTTTPVQVQIES